MDRAERDAESGLILHLVRTDIGYFQLGDVTRSQLVLRHPNGALVFGHQVLFCPFDCVELYMKVVRVSQGVGVPDVG